MAAAALCWSSGGLLARTVDTDTWTTVFWRGVFSAVFLLGIGAVRARRRGAPGGLPSTLGWPGLVMAMGFATASTCFINALARTSVANALVLQSTSPFIAALLGWALLGERVRLRTWLAMAAALVGTAVMASRSWGAGSFSGDVLAVITAAAFAAAAVTVRRHGEVNLPAAAGLAGLLGAAVALLGAAAGWWSVQPLSLIHI